MARVGGEVRCEVGAVLTCRLTASGGDGDNDSNDGDGDADADGDLGTFTW